MITEVDVYEPIYKLTIKEESVSWRKLVTLIFVGNWPEKDIRDEIEKKYKTGLDPKALKLFTEGEQCFKLETRTVENQRRSYRIYPENPPR